MPLFFLALAVKGRLRRAPLLATGLVLYSVVGRVMKDDVLWLTSEANSLDSITYGRQGSVLHYFKLSPYLRGVPLVLLVLAGLGWLLLR
jgi:hypothetical protein